MEVQVVRHQVTTDLNLIKLVETMENVYSFVDAIQSNVSEKVKVLEDVIKRILAQTIESSMFIKEYHKQGGFAGGIP
jgi:SPX domain protein involved in polyphosphate accumulation